MNHYENIYAYIYYCNVIINQIYWFTIIYLLSYNVVHRWPLLQIYKILNLIRRCNCIYVLCPFGIRFLYAQHFPNKYGVWNPTYIKSKTRIVMGRVKRECSIMKQSSCVQIYYNMQQYNNRVFLNTINAAASAAEAATMRGNGGVWLPKKIVLY